MRVNLSLRPVSLALTTGWTRPWLRRTHKSFFYAIVAEGVALIWAGVEVLFGDHDEQWHSPSLQFVNGVASPEVWAYWAGGIGVLLLVSLFRDDFRMTRIMLACMFFYVLLNFLLIAQARIDQLPTGLGLQVRLALLGNLFVQVRFEPPENPASE